MPSEFSVASAASSVALALHPAPARRWNVGNLLGSRCAQATIQRHGVAPSTLGLEVLVLLAEQQPFQLFLGLAASTRLDTVARLLT